MVVEKNNKFEDYKFKKVNLNFAVVGHVEWINFLKVDQLPKPGVISHSEKSLEYPAGAGSVIAKTLSELTDNQIHFLLHWVKMIMEIDASKFFQVWE